MNVIGVNTHEWLHNEEQGQRHTAIIKRIVKIYHRLYIYFQEKWGALPTPPHPNSAVVTLPAPIVHTQEIMMTSDHLYNIIRVQSVILSKKLHCIEISLRYRTNIHHKSKKSHLLIKLTVSR